MSSQDRHVLLPANGLAKLRSRYSVADTLSRLEGALTARGIRIFCRIDHAAEAAAVGLTMRPAVVLIFGNPKAGTQFMVEAPTAAIDLPLKALVYEDEAGTVWLSWNTVEYLRDRHGLTSDLQPLRAVEALYGQATGANSRDEPPS